MHLLFFLNYSFSYHLNWSMTAENKKIKKNEHPSQKPFDDAAMWFSSDHDHFLSKTIRWLFRCFYLHNFYFYPRNLFIAMYLCILCDILILYSNYGYFQWNERIVGSVAVPKSSLMIINYPIIIFWWYWYIWAFRYQYGIYRGLNVPPFTIYMRSIIVQRFSNYKDKEYKN